MKTAGLLVLLALALPNLAIGQDVSLLKDYEIPTYKYHSMVINSPNLFDYRTEKTDYSKRTEISSALQFDEYFVVQKPKDTRKLGGFIRFDYKGSKTDFDNNRFVDDKEEWLAILTLFLGGYRDIYLTHERGLYFHLAMQTMHQYYFNDSTSAHWGIYQVPVGLGYGRVVGVRNVVQAYMIADELGLDLSKEDVHALAEVIEKRENRYFEAKYRDDAEIEFYNRIAAITGQPARAMKVKQIISSPVYKAAQRFTGWQARLVVNNVYAALEDYGRGAYGDDYQAALQALVEYGLPVEFDKQFSVYATYSTPLTDLGDPTLGLGAEFSIDHNYHWSSTIAFTYRQLMPETGDDLASTVFRLETDYAVLNRLSILATLSRKTEEFTDTQDVGVEFPLIETLSYKRTTTKFHLGFKWYLFSR